MIAPDDPAQTPEIDDHADETAGDSVGGPDDAVDAPDEALLTQLAVIDDQPLADRAAAFTHLHDALRQQLEA